MILLCYTWRDLKGSSLLKGHEFLSLRFQFLSSSFFYISCHALTVHCTGQQLVRHSQKSFLQYICTLLKLSSLCCWHFFSTVWAGGLFASVHYQHLVGELLSTSAASPWHFSRTWILEGVNARGQVELISRFFSRQAKIDLEKHLFLHHGPGSWF